MWLTTDELNFVVGCPPADLNGVSTAFPCNVVNMAKYASMVAIVGCGAGSTYRIYAQYASTASLTPGSTGNFCIGNYRLSGLGTTASTCDLLGTRTALTTTGSSSVCIAATTQGFACVGSTPNVNAYIELKADDLPTGYPYVAICVSTAAQAHPCAVTYVMRAKYPQNTMLPACT